MIRREDMDGWILFTQFDHSKLSGDIMAYWGNEIFSRINSNEKVMYSITNHDKGWQYWDSKPRINPENHYPANFMDMYPEEKHGIWAKCFEEIPGEYAYSSALIALHFSKFNNNLLKHTPGNREILDFRDRINRHVSGILKTDKYSLKDGLTPGVLTDLKYIQIGDIISLTLCSGWLTTVIKDVPVDYNGKKTDLRLKSEDGFNYTVKPYPFSEQKIDIKIPGLKLTEKVYVSDNDLRTSIKNAESQNFDFTVKEIC